MTTHDLAPTSDQQTRAEHAATPTGGNRQERRRVLAEARRGMKKITCSCC